MAIEKKNLGNTIPDIPAEEIIAIHNKLIRAYNERLRVYGAQPLWSETIEGMDLTAVDIGKLNAKELQMIFLYKYINCFVHKDLISEFVRKYKPNAKLDQQVRHLGTQCNWYVLNKDTKVPDADEKVPSGYNYLVSIEMPNPKVIVTSLKRAGRSAARTFEELKYIYDLKCATCGLEEDKLDWRTGNKVRLQQGHMDPNKMLTIDNTIPQCEYCNKTYQDNFVFDQYGRIIKINNPKFVLRSDKEVKKEMMELLKEEK